MLTATEAKLISYKNKHYFPIVSKKILDAANNGETSCEISINEIINGTPGMLYEISYLLNELGYRTLINENIIDVYWSVQKPLFYDILGDMEEEEFSDF